MPIRFQVDGDFYDHPKTIDMSDAAVALWTRAGSYSAAKLTDGFVADAVLVRLSQTPAEASAELVRRGLWRRVRGGFQYHQWDQRNLLRARVEADREYDRKRKKAQRSTIEGPSRDHRGPIEGPSSGRRETLASLGDETRSVRNVQATAADVRSGLPPDIQPESGRSPYRSVSVSVSESVSGSGHGPPPPANGRASPPPSRCQEHLQAPTSAPCRACGDARQAHETWQAQRRARLDQAPQCPLHRGQPAANCGPCRSEELSAT